MTKLFLKLFATIMIIVAAVCIISSIAGCSKNPTGLDTIEELTVIIGTRAEQSIVPPLQFNLSCWLEEDNRPSVCIFDTITNLDLPFRYTIKGEKGTKYLISLWDSPDTLYYRYIFVYNENGRISADSSKNNFWVEYKF